MMDKVVCPLDITDITCPECEYSKEELCDYPYINPANLPELAKKELREADDEWMNHIGRL